MVPRFAPIANFDELPSPTSEVARERYVLEFKGNVEPLEWWELAKDIAAFANSLGGVLLVGAHEGEPPAYVGIALSRAREIQKAYEDVLNEHLSPRPIVDPVILLDPSGSAFVAVNVYPYPDQPVGSRMPSLNKKDKPVSSNAWQFPVRVGRHTRPLVPAMIPMMTNARVRRTVILLEAIPKPNPPNTIDPKLVWCHLLRHANDPQQTPVRIEAVDSERNVVVLKLCEQGRDSVIRVPLDDVEAVWEARPHEWCIRVSGLIHSEHSTDAPRYVSVPNAAPFIPR